MSTNHGQQATIQSFERLMGVVGKAIHEAGGNTPDPDRLSTIEALFEMMIHEIESRGYTHPPKVLSDLKHWFQMLSDAPQQLAARQYPIGHMQIWYQLWRYHDYLTVSGGAEQADLYFSELFSTFRRKPGRPADLPLHTVMKAKKLHDAGKSYGEVGILLSLGRQQVRTALRYHYPEKKPV